MRLRELVIESAGTLSLNKLRTGLAILGIVIGIGSVIALISLGQASQVQIQQQIQSIGSNLLTVQPGAQNQGGVRGAAGGVTTLTNQDAQAIKTSTSVTAVKNVSPEYSSRAQIVAGRNNINAQVIGVEEAYATVHKTVVSSGNFISQQDVQSLAKVAVIGPQVVSDLFGEGANPIGQTIKVSGKATFRIVGITESKGGTGFFNQDSIVFIPLSTAQKQLFGSDHITSIALEAMDEKKMTQAQNEVGYLLLARHKLTDPTEADFSIFSQSDILSTASQATSTFTALLGGIAAISLIVGGIGIMNIMLVTVTERTREIGLRKALGAKKKVITTQFLVEAVILTVAGGLIGMFVGILVSFVLTSVLNMPFALSIPSVLLAFLVSAGTGILFGWYPAKKAADLLPIEALRHE